MSSEEQDAVLETDAVLASLPARVRARVDALRVEVRDLLDEAQASRTLRLPEVIRFRIQNGAPRDVLTDWERAQSISFVTKFEHLPQRFVVDIQHEDGVQRIGNLDYLKHVLNEFRPLIQNRSDSIHYKNIHRTWRAMLLEKDVSAGTCISVLDNETDVTSTYVSWLDQCAKAITMVLKKMEFGYLYNGVLQHSDPACSERLMSDYTSGELNYVIWKHVLVLRYIGYLLAPYHRLISVLTFPKLGAL